MTHYHLLLEVLIKLNRLMIQLLESALKRLRAMRLVQMRSKTSSPNSLGQELAQSLISHVLRSFTTSSEKAASGSGYQAPMRAGSAGSLDHAGPFTSPLMQPLHRTTNVNAASM